MIGIHNNAKDYEVRPIVTKGLKHGNGNYKPYSLYYCLVKLPKSTKFVLIRRDDGKAITDLFEITDKQKETHGVIPISYFIGDGSAYTKKLTSGFWFDSSADGTGFGYYVGDELSDPTHTYYIEYFYE